MKKVTDTMGVSEFLKEILFLPNQSYRAVISSLVTAGS